jgi:5'-3' exonuclease
VSGQVYGVLSNDTDVLVYGSNKFITNLDIHRKTCVEVDYTEMLQSIELDSSQFRDFCIMCGTDYNKNIPRIGPEKSYQYIRKYSSIEGIKEALPNVDTSVLNHERVREIFRVPEEISTLEIPTIQPLDMEKIHQFAEEHSLMMADDCKSIVRNLFKNST